MPLSDRDYMRTPPPQREYRQRRSFNFSLSPLLLIIIANLILIIATLISPDGLFPVGGNRGFEGDKFQYYLGLIPYYFAERPWTIITAMFIHADFWHFFVNMLTLFFFGRALANFVGQNKLLLVYFIGGIVGNGLYLLIGLLGDPHTISFGASGAVYAVAGALTVIAPKIRVLLYFIVPVPLWIVVLIFFVIWSFVPGVAWEAHIGGLVVGLIAGYFFRRRARYYVF